MLRSSFLRFLFAFTFLLTILPLSYAQNSDFCGGLADVIAYNQTIESEISDQDVFGRYCFRGQEGDTVNIQIETIEGDLILSGALSDRFVEEIFTEYTATSSDEIIEIEFNLPENGSYLLLVSREDFGEGDTSGSFSLSLTSDDAPIVDDNTNSTFPQTLSNFDGYWENTVNALADANVINGDGQLIFNVQNAFFDGVGSFFTPVASATSRRDIVVSATLTFRTDSDSLETCSLLARVVGRDAVTTFLEVGLDNNGNIFWVDADGDDISSGTVETAVDLSELHHLIFVAQSDQLTIYLNGELVVEMAEISVGTGSFGIALLGGGPTSRCDGTNFWGYEAPVVTDGLCEATPFGDVNQRDSASTNSAIVGTFENGQYIEVIAITTDNTDFVWYQLSDRSFVREDVVSVVGDCENLPEIE